MWQSMLCIHRPVSTKTIILHTKIIECYDGNFFISNFFSLKKKKKTSHTFLNVGHFSLRFFGNFVFIKDDDIFFLNVTSCGLIE